MIREKQFQSGTLSINYAEGPARGTPLLLLHGGSGRWQGFGSIFPELSERYHLFAPDLRGHGQSGHVAGAYRLRDYAEDLSRFIEECVPAAPILFGHSLGGMVALYAAAYGPLDVRAIIVGDSPLTASSWRASLDQGRAGLVAWRDLAASGRSEAEIAAALAKSGLPGSAQDENMMGESLDEESPAIRWFASNLYRQDPDVLTCLIDDFETVVEGYEMERILPGIAAPVLLMQADPESSGLMADEDVAAAMRLLPNIEDGPDV